MEMRLFVIECIFVVSNFYVTVLGSLTTAFIPGEMIQEIYGFIMYSFSFFLDYFRNAHNRIYCCRHDKGGLTPIERGGETVTNNREGGRGGVRETHRLCHKHSHTYLYTHTHTHTHAHTHTHTHTHTHIHIHTHTHTHIDTHTNTNAYTRNTRTLTAWTRSLKLAFTN